MKTERRTNGTESAFTLTELALCIAVIAIALTAIIGVLPSGLNVQKQNREETLVAQDAQFLIETIRNGSMAIPDLLQHVDFIHWRRRGAESQDIYFRGPNFTEALPGTVINLTDPWQVTALLSSPRFEVVRRGIVTNDITGQFRAFSSPFSEKAYRDDAVQPSAGRFQTALRYLVSSESQGTPTRAPVVLTQFTNQVVSNIVANQTFRVDQSLSDLRLTFQWPVFRVGADFQTGNGRRTFRTLIQGGRDLLTTNFLGTAHPAYRFNGGRTNVLTLVN